MGKISDAMQNVVDEIGSSAEARGTALRELSEEAKQLMKDTHNAMKDIHRINEAQAKDLRDRLSSERKAGVEETRGFMEDVEKFIEGIRVRTSEMRSGNQNLLERFHLEHGDMAKTLREGLSSARVKLSSDEKVTADASRQFMEEVHNTNSECREAVREMLDEIASDLGQADQIWTKGLGKKVVRKAVVKEAVQEIKKKAGTEKEKILEVVARHPDGIKLIDMGNELGVDWRTLIGPIKSLVDKDKVEKIDTMYYPQ